MIVRRHSFHYHPRCRARLDHYVITALIGLSQAGKQLTLGMPINTLVKVMETVARLHLFTKHHHSSDACLHQSCLPTLQMSAGISRQCFFKQMMSEETIGRTCFVNHVCTIFVSINL